MHTARYALLFSLAASSACKESEPSSQPAATSHASAAHTATAAPHETAASAEPASASPSKDLATPYFSQLDPEHGFPNKGSDYCAPVSLSSGLLYLAKGRGMKEIAKATDEKAQVALVNELARDLATDPKEGTSPDGIATGMLKFAEAHGFGVKRLEIATWRGLGKANEPRRIAQKPDLEWLRSAASDPDTIVLANVGWYKKDTRGFERNSGHWVDVVAAGPEANELEVRNSLLKPEEQKTKKRVTLTRLDKFDRVDGKTVSSMTGYFKVEGPALAYGGSTAAAVLDCVIVFTAKR